MAELLYPVAEIRRIEHDAVAALPPGTLMARAGAAVARLAHQVALDRPGAVLFLAGPGNNGGDALVAARLLADDGIEVRVVLFEPAEKFHGDALSAWRALDSCGIEAQTAPEKLDLARVTLIVDGLFGIGLKADAQRGLPPLAAHWIARINAAGLPELAVDVPSGLDADTGGICGIAVRATHTLSFLGAKPGFYTGEGRDHCGAISVDQLGVALPLGSMAGKINGPGLFAGALHPRSRNSHKGQFGNLGVCGGASGMTGAALLAARMGLQAGAGRVYLRLLDPHAPSFDAQQPELMLRTSLDDLKLQALVAGPGMGRGDLVHETLLQACANPATAAAGLVLDADALNAIGASRSLQEAVAARSAPTVLTPHPLEAARLLGSDAADVQADRIGAAKEIAWRYHAIVVLKGAGTVIADDNALWAINTTGNPALATGGSGDVLAGLIGALLAQGITPWFAALAGTWLHGTAADDLVAQGVGPVGLTASELIPAIRRALNRSFAAAS